MSLWDRHRNMRPQRPQETARPNSADIADIADMHPAVMGTVRSARNPNSADIADIADIHPSPKSMGAGGVNPNSADIADIADTHPAVSVSFLERLLREGRLDHAGAAGVGLAVYEWWGSRDMGLAWAVPLDCPRAVLHWPFLPESIHGREAWALGLAERAGLAVRAGCWRTTARAEALRDSVGTLSEWGEMRRGWLEAGGVWKEMMPGHGQGGRREDRD